MSATLSAQSTSTTASTASSTTSSTTSTPQPQPTASSATKDPYYALPDYVELDAAVVKPKAQRYRRKGNPAVELIKEIIANKELNTPEGRDAYSVEEYDKLIFAFNNFFPDTIKHKRLNFVFDHIDFSELTGQPIMMISMREALSDIYHRKNPKARKQIVKARRTVGVDKDYDPNGSFTANLENLFKTIDVYDDDIEIFGEHFVGPLSGKVHRVATADTLATGSTETSETSGAPLAITYYKYYIEDTLIVSGTPCTVISFVPASDGTGFGFTGRLFVANDETHSLRKAILNTPLNLDLNLIHNLRFEQEFEPQAPQTTQAPTPHAAQTQPAAQAIAQPYLTSRKRLLFNMSPIKQGSAPVYVVKTTTYRNYNFNPNLTIFNSGDNIGRNSQDLPGATNHTTEYWVQNRHEDLSKSEREIEIVASKIYGIKAVDVTAKIVDAIASDFVPTAYPSDQSYFDIGNLSSILGFNEVEGFKTRIGGRTTAHLNPHIGATGYVAYGFRDKQFKYAGQLTYSINPMKVHFNEHPRHRLTLRYEKDIFSAEDSEFKDNMFYSVRVGKQNRQMQYISTGMLKYEKEWNVGVMLTATVEHKTYRPAGDMIYADAADPTKVYWGFRSMPLTLGLRIAPGEKFYNASLTERSTIKNTPVILLSHSYAPGGIFNSDYRGLNRTDFSFDYRIWMGPAGSVDTKIRAAAVWNKVPFPLLLLPASSQSIMFQRNVFHMMQPFEFVCDKYVSWDITWRLKGLILGNIPGIKWLKLREAFLFSGMWGGLSAKNNPALNPEGLFAFPADTHALNPKLPYMEIGCGIENIFKIIGVYYVHRLTYQDLPGVKKHGVRVGFHFEF